MRRTPQDGCTGRARTADTSEVCTAPRRLLRRGFTLLEVMLVVALLAVASTLFFVNLESLGRSSPADEFEGTFWRAMAQAREQALATRRTVGLRWDAESKAFLVDGTGGLASVPVPAETRPQNADYEATLSEEVAANDFILVRGELVTRRTTAAVRIFPDGTCQAFAIEFRLGEHRHRVAIDPWTGAEMLPLDAARRGGRS